MTSCEVILTSRVSIFRCKHPTTFELCYAIFKISATDRHCFFYEEAAITTDFSHIGSSTISCCFPIPSRFLIMSIRHLTFDGSAFICAAFLITWPLFSLLPTFQGTDEEVAALLNLAHPYMVSPFLFLNLSLLSFLTSRWPIWVCSMLVAKKGIATIESTKPSIIFTWTCRRHSWTLTGINGRSKPLRSEFDTPWCAYYFFFISFISDFISCDRTNGVCSISTSSGPTLLHS